MVCTGFESLLTQHDLVDVLRQRQILNSLHARLSVSKLVFFFRQQSKHALTII